MAGYNTGSIVRLGFVLKRPQSLGHLQSSPRLTQTPMGGLIHELM